MSPSHHSEDQTDEPVRQFTHFAATGLLAVAGGLHLAALPGHLHASTAAGAFFAVTAAAQLLGAVLVATRPSSQTIRAVIAGNAAVLTLWATSRTAGLPTGGGLGVREPFGLLDGFAAAVEVLAVVAGLATLVHRSTSSGRRSGGWRLALVLVGTWGLAGGAGLAIAEHGDHHSGRHAHSEPAPGRHSHEDSSLSVIWHGEAIAEVLTAHAEVPRAARIAELRRSLRFRNRIGPMVTMAAGGILGDDFIALHIGRLPGLAGLHLLEDEVKAGRFSDTAARQRPDRTSAEPLPSQRPQSVAA